MTFKKGVSGNPRGRQKGSKNQMSKAIQQAFHSLVEGNISEVGVWLNRVAEKDPDKALELLIRLSGAIFPSRRSEKIFGYTRQERIAALKIKLFAE